MNGGDEGRLTLSRHRDKSDAVHPSVDAASTSRAFAGATARVGAMADPAIDDFYAVIPAGGIGSRLWPLSRADAPKFLHDLTGSGQTLLRDTWDRLGPLSGEGRIAVVTGRAHRAAVERELPGVPDHNVFLESEPRDSSAAIGLAAAILVRREPDVIIGSFAPTMSSVRLASSSSPCVRPSRSPARGTSARSASSPPKHRSGSATSSRPVSSSSTALPRPTWWNASSRSPTWTPRRSTSPTAPTSGTRACSSRVPTCSSPNSPSTSPSCTRACSNWPRPGTTATVAAPPSTASGRG